MLTETSGFVIWFLHLLADSNDTLNPLRKGVLPFSHCSHKKQHILPTGHNFDTGAHCDHFTLCTSPLLLPCVLGFKVRGSSVLNR